MNLYSRLSAFLLLRPAWHYLSLVLFGLALTVSTSLATHWYQNQRIAQWQHAIHRLNTQLDHAHQTSGLHSAYITRLIPTSVRQGMTLADQWVSNAQGTLVRMEGILGQPKHFRLEAVFDTNSFYRWVAEADNRRLIIDSFVLEQYGYSLRVRTVLRTP